MHVVLDGQLALLENSVSRYVRNLLIHLVRLAPQHHYTLLVRSPRTDSLIRQEHPWIPDSSRIAVFPGPENPYFDSAAQTAYKQNIEWPRELRRLKASIFHGQYNNLPRRGKSYKLVSTVHDVFRWVPGVGRTRPGDSLRRAHERLLYRRAHVLVADSENTRNDFKRFLDSRPELVVAPLGVDPQFTPLADDHDASQRAQLGLDSHPYVLYLGDLQPRKNVATLLHAWAAAHPPFHLVIGGSTWNGSTVERDLAARLGLEQQVQFLGRVPESALPAVYRGATLFVFPSLYEGFGLPPLEAMACGVPVLVSESSSMPEVVGDAGAYFPPMDANVLAQRLNELLSDTAGRQKMSALGTARAATFTWDGTARRTLQAYEQCVADGSFQAGHQP